MFLGRTGQTEVNLVTGRFALQYAGAGSLDSRFDFSQPSVLMRLDIARVFGTGLTFSMYGRTYYDLSDQYPRYGEGSRLKLRMYEFSLSYDDDRAWYGYTLGRVTSRFVGGLGVFDGGQVFIRRNNVAVGLLLGTQADYRTSGIDGDQQKVAAFVNCSWGGEVFRQSDITFAYGQQLYQGKLDRDFLYLQTSARFGSEVSLYQSSEIDLHKISAGTRSGALRVTNTFVTLSYSPVSWLNSTGGYDATRNVYLFESMKSIPDTLLDKKLQQGYRAGATVRLPYNVALFGTANFRLKRGTTRSARTLGGGVRVSDIARTQLNAGVQYSSIMGVYTEGNDVTVDVDCWMSTVMSLSLRIDRYAYTLLTQSDRLVTTTAGANVNYRISRSWYCVFNIDQVWDSTRNSQRIYFELGVHF